ncbi:hydroxymethylpyrimidine/phosphomethylpyrimidine kinase [Pedobacter sp. N36a]|uniref:hydroxymethylpyrimidine/phosphomethylpyrimidine kinase n=1 Tax=Pedobacter sp. N36a TaxID=2767996 RepID=UPI001656F86F|nr:hydroxymethylpyrimidine/phosphomethylpyrimidine kinase [Pedobacter sp. N36a]MBC8984253.1 hydroxymethylpyrimidine/phosphomethylpyrimidine kinase [Pedobacter sp. N36a]
MSNHRIVPSTDRPYVISIAGLDPSAGAGLLSDMKTFEAHRVYGFGVCTAMTIQTDTAFLKNDWLEREQILAQLQPFLDKFPIRVVKIGLIKDLETLLAVCDCLISFDSEIKIVLDPILTASAGHNFNDWTSDSAVFKDVLKRLYLITPNYLELQTLIGADQEGQKDIKAVARICLKWSMDCAVLLKGGHHPLTPGTDYFFDKNERLEFSPGSPAVYPKHGSGCVLSSAITAQLALGNSLQKSCLFGKQYIEKFLNSNTSLLGDHNS